MIGKTIDRYKITAKLGEGGMGVVWKAEDSVLDRTVALKFLPQSLATSEDARKRFLREAKAPSKLDHSGIATNPSTSCVVEPSTTVRSVDPLTVACVASEARAPIRVDHRRPVECVQVQPCRSQIHSCR